MQRVHRRPAGNPSGREFSCGRSPFPVRSRGVPRWSGWRAGVSQLGADPGACSWLMMDGELARMIAAAVSGGVSAHEDIRVESCGGGNNRVFSVFARGHSLVVKKYYASPGDARDRFRAEAEFLRYAHAASLECVPHLLFADLERRV